MPCSVVAVLLGTTLGTDRRGNVVRPGLLTASILLLRSTEYILSTTEYSVLALTTTSYDDEHHPPRLDLFFLVTIFRRMHGFLVLDALFSSLQISEAFCASATLLLSSTTWCLTSSTGRSLRRSLLFCRLFTDHKPHPRLYPQSYDQQ